MSEAKVLLHVGLPKAASTTLQRSLLCNRELGFVPFHHSISDAASVSAVDHFISKCDLAFCPKETREFYDAQVGGCGGSNDVIWVLSQEQLAGNPDKGLYYTKEVGSRLRAVFPGAKVLIVIREQVSYALSCYNQRIRSGSNISIERFIGSDGTTSPGYPSILNRDFLCYHLLVEYYQSLFGEQNVLVLPFEKVIREHDRCMCKILSFSELPSSNTYPLPSRENRGEGMYTVRLRRFLNTFTGEAGAFRPYCHAFTWRPVSGLLGVVDSLLPRSIHEIQRKRYLSLISESFNGCFSHSNERLSRAIGVNLKDYGYM